MTLGGSESVYQLTAGGFYVTYKATLHMERTVLTGNQCGIFTNAAYILDTACKFSDNEYDACLYYDGIVYSNAQLTSELSSDDAAIEPVTDATPKDFLQADDADLTTLRKVQML